MLNQYFMRSDLNHSWEEINDALKKAKKASQYIEVQDETEKTSDLNPPCIQESYLSNKASVIM